MGVRGIVLSLLVQSFAWAQVQPIEEIFFPEGEYAKEDFVKVAVVQWAPEQAAPLGSLELANDHKLKNRQKLEEYIREAHTHGAEFIVTPEFATIGYPDIPELPSEDDNFRSREDLAYYVESLKGENAEFFKQLAKELNVWIQVGFAERDEATDAYYNSVIVVNAEGEIIAHYRKQSLFRLEENYLSKGESPVVFDSPFGRVGLAICSDIYAGYVMNPYQALKIDVLSISTSWASYNSGWSYFLSASKWLNSHVIVSNHNYFPDSGVILQDGTIQSHIRQSTGLAYGYLVRKVKP